MSDGWRGRAQQIVMLKTKVKRLESMLGGSGILGDGATISTLHGGATVASEAVTFASSRRSNDVDSKATADLVAMQSSRQQVRFVSTPEMHSQSLIPRKCRRLK